DEPTGNLDEKTVLDIVRVLKSLKEGGKTVIVSTHHPKISELADKGILMEEGEIVRTVGNP
ncbi:MAG: ABC transporter ATP-binding protein, partial [Candidatus Bathyarchaeia archaeon]